MLRIMDKITLAQARIKFGSNYHIARLLGLNASSVCRWGRWVPDKYAAILISTPGLHLSRGGKRDALQADQA
jgi:hypothetical protein